MHDITDWASLHSITLDDVRDSLQAFHANALAAEPWHWRPLSEKGGAVPASQESCFADLICPALVAWLDPESEHDLSAALRRVGFSALDSAEAEQPFATYDPATGQAAIVMDWGGTPADLLCLAHETGHVAQYVLSQSNAIPPVARETCAFVAELIVIDALASKDPALRAALQLAWDDDTVSYLDEDAAVLAEALKDPQTPYHYRMNYPLARLAAVHLYNRVRGSCNEARRKVTKLFSNGAESLTQVGLSRLAALGDAFENYLPKFVAAGGPDQAGYQSLGAMILLDIDAYKGPSEDTIQDTYHRLLPHLQSETAFLALRPDGRPIGYATWEGHQSGSSTTVTHQTAPFGDHLVLQRALRQRLTHAHGIAAHAPRSARQEQVVWWPQITTH